MSDEDRDLKDDLDDLVRQGIIEVVAGENGETLYRLTKAGAEVAEFMFGGNDDT